MAFPSKVRDLRRIIVNEKEFRWRLQAWVPDSWLLIYGASSGTPLRIKLHKWMDHRAMYPFLMPNTPETIGSGFIRQAIEFALQNGWMPEERGSPFGVEWDGKTFRLNTEMSFDLHECKR